MPYLLISFTERSDYACHHHLMERLSHLLKEIKKRPHATIFLDVDGTLVPDGTDVLDNESVQFIDEIRNGHKVVLASNSIRKERTETLARVFDLPTIKTKKPTSEACAEALSYKTPYIVVGDKWWIDGGFAKKIGAHFFLVKPLYAKTDGITMTVQYIFAALTSWFWPIASLFIKSHKQ